MATIKSTMRELRTPLTGTLQYVSGCGNAGQAIWINISRTGAAVQLGRYLRPGHTIELELTGREGTESRRVPARIVWCERIPGSLLFRAGLAVERRNPEIALHFATLGYEALAMNKTNNYTVTTAGWSSDAAAPALSKSPRAHWVRAV